MDIPQHSTLTRSCGNCLHTGESLEISQIGTSPGTRQTGDLGSPNPGVCVFRVLVIHRHIVLATHVVCDVVIHDQPRQSFEIEEFE